MHHCFRGDGRPEHENADNEWANLGELRFQPPPTTPHTHQMNALLLLEREKKKIFHENEIPSPPDDELKGVSEIMEAE